jgi:ribonuclease HII
MIKRLGIDENGLGPIMGPLIITGVETEKTNKDKNNQHNIKDSKKIFRRKQEDFKTLEKIFLRYSKTNFKTISDVFSKSMLKDEIERICPIGPDKICFSNKISLPVWIKEEGNEDLLQNGTDLNLPGLHFGEVKRAIFMVVCPNILSKYIERFGSKFSANSFFMVRLGLKSSAEEVICGKSGYKKSYEREISLAIEDERDKSLNLKIVMESEKESIYEIMNNGEIIKRFYFIKDADQKFPEVALASIIGKYIREISMFSITKFIEPNSQKPISGYGRKNAFEEISRKIIEKSKYEFSKEIPKTCIIRER